MKKTFCDFCLKPMGGKRQEAITKRVEISLCSDGSLERVAALTVHARVVLPEVWDICDECTVKAVEKAFK